MKTIVILILIILFWSSGCCRGQLTDVYLDLKYKENGYSYLLFCAGMGCFEDKKGETYEEVRIKLLEAQLKQWCEINNCNASDYEILYRQVVLPSWSNDTIFGLPEVVYDIRLKMNR